LFGFAPDEVLKTLKEQAVAFNNHKKCVPTEVSWRLLFSLSKFYFIRFAMQGMQFTPALSKNDFTVTAKILARS